MRNALLKLEQISVCEGIAQEILEAALHSLDTGFSALRSTKVGELEFIIILLLF